jgi:hypothetical protein
MHRGHDHDHHHLNGGGGSLGGSHPAAHAPIGHNRASAPAQWQTPHLDKTSQHAHADPQSEPDLDQVEAAFVDGFALAPDPTSFLRLASIPFEATTATGEKLVLLRVETDAVVDVGSVMPHLGGTSFRYDPLPAKMAAKRRRLRFVYFDGKGLRPLTFAEARGLDKTSA